MWHVPSKQSRTAEQLKQMLLMRIEALPGFRGQQTDVHRPGKKEPAEAGQKRGCRRLRDGWYAHTQSTRMTAKFHTDGRIRVDALDVSTWSSRGVHGTEICCLSKRTLTCGNRTPTMVPGIPAQVTRSPGRSSHGQTGTAPEASCATIVLHRTPTT